MLAALSLLAMTGCIEWAGAEAEITQRLARVGERRETLRLDGVGSLAVSSARFTRLVVKPEGEGMVAVGTVDLEGSLSIADAPPGTAPIAVSLLGLERIPFVRRGDRWDFARSPLPYFAETAKLLLARSPAPLPSRWIVRTDRDRIEVHEEGERPLRLVLVREGGVLRIVD